MLETTDDEAMEVVAWRYLRWFYDQAEAVYASAEPARRALIVKGVSAGKVRVLPVVESVTPDALVRAV
jgi:hypothetical protein